MIVQIGNIKQCRPCGIKYQKNSYYKRNESDKLLLFTVEKVWKI